MTGVETFLAANAASIAAASAAASALSIVQQSRQAGAVADFNARVMENEADAAAEAGRFEAERVGEGAERTLSGQRAAAADNGLQFTGSPLLVAADTAEDAALDEQAILFSSSVAEARARSQASLDRFRGRQTRSAAPLAAAAQLLTGGARIAALKA